MAFSHSCFSSHHFAVFQQQLLMHLVLPLQRKLDDFQWQILCTVDGWFQVQRKKLGGKFLRIYCPCIVIYLAKQRFYKKICLFSVFLKTSWPYEPFYVMKIHQVALLPGHEMDDNNISQRDFPFWRNFNYIFLFQRLSRFVTIGKYCSVSN